jgi:hypothetical protein
MVWGGQLEENGEKCSKIVVMVTKLCEYTKNH